MHSASAIDRAYRGSKRRFVTRARSWPIRWVVSARSVGKQHVAVPYGEDWQPLRDEGFAAYLRRVSGPYSRAVGDRLDPAQASLTERGLTKLRRREPDEPPEPRELEPGHSSQER